MYERPSYKREAGCFGWGIDTVDAAAHVVICACVGTSHRTLRKGIIVRPRLEQRTIDGRTCDPASALLIADNDCPPDELDCHYDGTNLFLFRAPEGFYFTQLRSRWRSETDGHVELVNLQKARELYEEQLLEHRVPVAEAFPGVETG